jgi:ankyrin repeat protein
LLTLIKHGADLTIVSQEGNLVLHDLIQANTDLDLFRRVVTETDRQLTSGIAAWNCKGKDGMTPLMLAVRFQHKLLLELLISFDADLLT